MAIKMRRGADADFRPEKMQPGELAVTVDGTRKVYAAFAAGDVKELSSKEDVDKTIASGLQSLETSTNNKLQSLEKKASSAVDKISSENHRVQEELSRYEYYTKTESDLKYTVAPRKEASSANGELKLTDADDGLSYLELQGNSEQYTNTANTNMLDVEYNKSLGLHGTDKFLRTTGEINVSGNWSYSYYIKVAPNTLYSFVGIPASPAAAFVFYTKDKTHISGITIKDAVIDLVRAVTTPNNCEWMRISYVYTTDNPQMYLGELPSQGVYGAVDTPSPDYPSEVRSVGDIPKDVNGVEIRNILDIDGILARPDSDWTVPASGRTFSISLDVSKQKIGGRLFEAISHPRFNLGLSNSTTSLGDGTSGFYLAAPSIPYKGFDFSSSAAVNLFIYVTGTDPIDLAMVKEILDKERNKFVFTYASEVDEYRPYIGENNGLVKMEAAGKNMFMVNNVKPNDQTTSAEIMGDTIKVNGAWYANCKILNLKKNTNYTLSGTVLSANAVIRISLYDYTANTIIKNAVNKYGGITSADFKEYSATFNTENIDLSHDYMVTLYCGNGTTNQGTTVYKNIQLEEGTIKTKYQPYHQQITWISLREPLRGIRGSDTIFYADKIDKDGYVTQNIYFVKGKDMSKFTTDASGINTSDNPYKWAYWSQDEALWALKSTKNILCNILKRGNFNVNQMAISNTSVIVFNLPNTLTGLANAETDRAAIAAAIKAWVNTNNPLVYYVLEKPITYQIPAVYIETYDQETNVWCLNKVKPSDMTLDYKIAMSSLIKRLEALEAKTVQEV